MKKNHPNVNTNFGRIEILLSSNDTNYVQNWNEPIFYPSYNRWFKGERLKMDNWEVCKMNFTDYFVSTGAFHSLIAAHCVRESYIITECVRNSSDIPYFKVALMEYEQSKRRAFVFNLVNISEIELDALRDCIMEWHITGELTSDNLLSAFGSWKEF